MIHNVVARRTSADEPARSLTPHAVACDTPVTAEPAQRRLVRSLPLRHLVRTAEGGR
jgi:hypothetical protein